MGLWDIFNKTPKKEFFNQIHEKLHNQFPNDDETDLLKTACLAGLLASVAYVDLEIHDNEKEVIKISLIDWMKIDQAKAELIANLAIDNVKELTGIENYTYSEILSNNFSKDDCYAILETLFQVAASDGSVSTQEAEEIRTISRGLKLDNQHFIAARATVLEHLGVLKS